MPTMPDTDPLSNGDTRLHFLPLTHAQTTAATKYVHRRATTEGWDDTNDMLDMLGLGQ